MGQKCQSLAAFLTKLKRSVAPARGLKAAHGLCYVSLASGCLVSWAFQCINKLLIVSVSAPLFNLTSLLFLLLSFVQRSDRKLAHHGWV